MTKQPNAPPAEPQIQGLDAIPTIFCDNAAVNMRGNLTRLVFIEGGAARSVVLLETHAAVALAQGIIGTRDAMFKQAMAETAKQAPEGASAPIPPRAN